MTNKTGDDEGEEEAEGEEIYHDAIGEEGRTKESSGINENEDAQKEGENNDDVGSLRFSRVMKPAVTEVSWIREGRGSVKEKITPKDTVRKF